MTRKNRDRKRQNGQRPRKFDRRADTVDRRGTPYLDFWREMEGKFAQFTVMLGILTTVDGSANVLTSAATGSLVDTGRKRILVTNHHVYSEFRFDKSNDPQSKLVMVTESDPFFWDISVAECIGFDKDVDLAVLSLQPEHVTQAGRLFAQSTAWPPRRPDVGMFAITMGYPGEGRELCQTVSSRRGRYLYTVV